MKKTLSKVLAVVLSLTLAVGAISVFAPKQTTMTTAAKQKSVYDEIKLSKLSDKKLENVAKTALDDGAKAAKEVNSYKNKEDYKAALNSAMTSFYKKNNKKQLKNFTKNLDKRAKSTVANYEKAAKERAKGWKNGFVPGEVIAIFDEDVTKKQIEDVCKSQDATLKRCFKIHTNEYMAVITISLGDTVDAASKAFSKLSFIQAADSNDLSTPAESKPADETTITNDDANYTSKAYHFDKMHVKGAWDYLQTHQHGKVKVAVIDCGLYHNNPDITDVITDDSFDAVSKRPIREMTYDSRFNHGTAVSGTIAAKSNNGFGIAGVASGYDNDIVDIMAINAAVYDSVDGKIYLPNEYTYYAYDYAIDHGVKVINMSYGALGKNDTTETYLRKMFNKGIVLVAAGGNDRTNRVHYPSDSKYVISVANINQTNTKSYYSNYGSEKNICAPGNQLPCLDYNNSVSLMSGTSFASPATAAVSAMMLAVNPNLDTFDIIRIMQNTDTNLAGVETNSQLYHGVVNAEKCVKAADGYSETDTYAGEQDGFVNVAANAEVSVSYDNNGLSKNDLIDENINTYGAATVDANQNMILELDKEYDIDHITVSIGSGANATLSFSSSLDGNGYSSYYTMFRGELGGEYSSMPYGTVGKTRKAKFVKVQLSNVSATSYVSEVEVWVKGKVTRPADACTVEAKIAEPTDLKAEILGYHKVKLTWDVNYKMTAKGYEYDVYDQGVKVATTSDNSIVLNDTVGAKGGLSYGVRSKYNGKTSDGAATYSTSVVWNDYLTTSGTTEVPTAAPLTNLALGKTVVASSEENGGVTADKAVDGDENTRWSSQWTDDEWIYVDLGKIYTVARMEIKWETARASVYDTYLSIDGKNWTKYASNGQNAENTTDYLGRYARYVKIQGVSRNTGYGYSIYEWKVLGYEGEGSTVAPTTTKEQTTVPTTSVQETTTYDTNVRRLITSYDIGTENIAIGKDVSSSSDENDNLKAEKAVDGDKNTRWASNFTDDEWICVDLGKVTPVAMLKLHWEAARGKDYNILFSLDGKEWFVKKYTTNNTLADTTEAFLPEYTRYVKIEGKKRATGYGYSLFELEILPAIPKNEMISTAYPTTVAPTTEATTVAPTTAVPTTSAMNLTNLALGATGSASSSENDAMGALKAFDGDMNTRWASAWEDNQFIRVNLGAQKYINHIVINWETAYAKSYDIQLSSNGKVWSTKKSITNSDGGIDTVQINDSAMFVRLVCNTRATGYGISIYEMAVMGY